MGRTIWMVLLTWLVASLAACGGNVAPNPAAGGAADGDPSRPDPSGGLPPPNGSGSAAKIGIVAIDLQRSFFAIANARNPKSNPNERMKRAERMFTLAAQKHIPFFITYEGSKTGDHALPPSLAAVLPGDAREIIKTTFAATGQPQFLPRIDDSGSKHLLVLGAETDVCVLQTILGLKKRGFNVIAITDALLTEEVNSGPALRRMKQAGVAQITMAEAEALLESGKEPEVPSGKPIIVRPLEMGFLLHDIEGLGAPDTNAAAKRFRLRELLMVSEWFKIPLFAIDPQATTNALPQDLKSILSRPITALAQRPAAITQLAVAGGHTNLATVPNVEAFFVEDALVGSTSMELEPLYAAGGVPLTYKTLYYELTQSVDDAEWPSQQWVKDGDVWFDRTSAPEDLPQLVFP